MIARPSLPEYLTTEQVAQLAHTGIDTVRKAVFRTRAGEAARGSRHYLPRARAVRAGFRLRDVLAWLDQRGQVPQGFESLVPAAPAPRLGRAVEVL